MNGTYAICCGMFIFMIGMFGYSSDLGEGKQADRMTYGVWAVSAQVILFHVMLALITRDWNCILVFFFIFSCLNLPLTQWGNNSMESSWVYKAVFGQIIPAVSINLEIVLCVVACALPFMLWLRY